MNGVGQETGSSTCLTFPMRMTHFLTYHQIDCMNRIKGIRVIEYITPGPILCIRLRPFAGTGVVTQYTKLIIGFIVIILIEIVISTEFSLECQPLHQGSFQTSVNTEVHLLIIVLAHVGERDSIDRHPDIVWTIITTISTLYSYRRLTLKGVHNQIIVGSHLLFAVSKREAERCFQPFFYLSIGVTTQCKTFIS